MLFFQYSKTDDKFLFLNNSNVINNTDSKLLPNNCSRKLVLEHYYFNESFIYACLAIYLLLLLIYSLSILCIFFLHYSKLSFLILIISKYLCKFLIFIYFFFSKLSGLFFTLFILLIDLTMALNILKIVGLFSSYSNLS